MKKIVLTAQVLGLIAMFPIVVVLELNHIPGDPSENNSPSIVIKETEKVRPAKANDKMVNGAFTIMLETPLLKKTF